MDCMSLMFIFMPPGMTMSPGFWSALQAPIHFASIVVAARNAGCAGIVLGRALLEGRFALGDVLPGVASC